MPPLLPEPVETVEAEPAQDRHTLLTEQFDLAEKDAGAATPEAHANHQQPALVDGRDEKGKFTAKGAPAAKDATSPVPAPVEEPLWSKPPKSWKPETHEAWKVADPKLREYVHSREEQMRKGVEPLIAKAKFADEMGKVIEPHMSTIRSLGIDAPQAVSALMRADQILRSSAPAEKLAYFGKLAQSYGVNIGEIQVAPQGQQPARAQIDPQVQQQLNELLGWRQQQEQERNQALLSDIERFAADPKNEHFEAARPTMVRLLNSGEADTLDAAYKKALRLDDSLFALTHATPGADDAGKAAAAKDAAAKTARSAAVSVRSSSPGAATTAKAQQDRRSMLAEQFGGLSGRV